MEIEVQIDTVTVTSTKQCLGTITNSALNFLHYCRGCGLLDYTYQS
jgi:hypothetical protein